MSGHQMVERPAKLRMWVSEGTLHGTKVAMQDPYLINSRSSGHVSVITATTQIFAVQSENGEA